MQGNNSMYTFNFQNSIALFTQNMVWEIQRSQKRNKGLLKAFFKVSFDYM